MYLLPVVRNEGNNSGRSRTQLLKRTSSKMQHSQDLTTHNPTSITSPLKIAQSRQLPAPPFFPSSSPTVRQTSRKASAPARVSVPKLATASPEPQDPTCHVSPTTSPPLSNTHAAGGLYPYYYPGPSTPSCSQSPLDSALGGTTQITQGLSYPITNPTTPPALLPGIFSEPFVVPSTPVYPPGSSLIISDPATQFQLQSDYFNLFPVSHLSYSRLPPGLTASSSCSRGAFEAPLRPDYLSHSIPAPITPEPFESNVLYAVF